jgi:hypothetical protein
MVPHSREIRKNGLYDLLAHSMHLERAVSCVAEFDSLLNCVVHAEEKVPVF